MGLSAWLGQRAAIAPLIVTVPGGTGARLAVERVVREKGWRAAQNPAGASLVIVAGTPAADFESYLLRLMATVPEPHERVDIVEGDDVAAKLTAAIHRMRSTDPAQHRTAGHEDSGKAGGHHGARSPSGHGAGSGHHEHTAHQHGMPHGEPGPGDETHPHHGDASHRAEPSSMGAEAEAPQGDSAAANRDSRPANPSGNAHEHRSHEHDHDIGGAEESGGHPAADQPSPPHAHGHPGHEHADMSGTHHGDHGSDHADHMSHGGESASSAGMAHGGNGHDHHGGHGHHGHDMGMELPGGLTMADRAPDRDGLMLDVLTIPMGPVSASWPTGLALTTRMQGDVIDEVTVSLLGPSTHTDPFWVRPWLRASEGTRMAVGEGERYSAAWRFDSAAALLAVTGWRDGAAVACRLRDELLDGERTEVFRARLNRWARQVSGSAVLRWALRRVGHIAAGPEVPAELVGDVHDRLLRWVHDIANLDATGETPSEPGEYVRSRVACAQWAVDSLPDLLRGVEVAEARLIVASLALDVELLTWSSNSTGAVHG